MSGIDLRVDPASMRRLLATLADMDQKSSQSLQRKAMRQAMGPLQRRIRKQWKSHPVVGDSDKRVRKAIARATLLRIDRWRKQSRLTGGSTRSVYGKVYISYQNKYGPAKLAHLLENPRGDYQVPTSWKIHTREYRRWIPRGRAIFAGALRAFLAGYAMKDIRKAVKGKYG